MLISQSKYSVMLSKIHSYDCFFGDFAHWVAPVSAMNELNQEDGLPTYSY